MTHGALKTTLRRFGEETGIHCHAHKFRQPSPRAQPPPASTFALCSASWSHNARDDIAPCAPLTGVAGRRLDGPLRLGPWDVRVRCCRSYSVERRNPQSGDNGGVNPPDNLPPPVVPRPHRLPVQGMGWERFQDLVTDVFNALPEVEKAYLHGRRGEKQDGVDGFAELHVGGRWSYQCKDQATLTRGEVDAIVTGVTANALRHHIALSGSASVHARNAIAELEQWRLWDGDDICRELRNLDPTVAGKIIDHHFNTAWRREFLGTSQLLAFVSVPDFFAKYLEPGRLFDHSLDISGRDTELRQLADFAGGTKVVAILPGRGGIGKSRLLRAFGEQMDASASTVIVRFHVDDMPIDADTLDELPTTALIVVVDDAHRCADLGALLTWMHMRDAPCHLVLATRPHGIEQLRGQLIRFGIDPASYVVFPELRSLSHAATVAVAEQVLGDGFAHLAEPLTNATADCVLITVVGGRLLAQHHVPPDLLEREEDFRDVVLTRFADDLTAVRTDVEHGAVITKILPVIVAIQPMFVHNNGTAARIAEFVNEPVENVVSAIDCLEAGGLLVRRGRTLRIAPDVLADYILRKGCATRRGESTGFGERLFTHFADISMASLMRNLAELDWRLSRDAPSTLLSTIWSAVEETIVEGDADLQLALLTDLRDAAAYQPARVVSLIRRLLDDPRRNDADDRQTREFVRGAMGPLLRETAYSADKLEESCALLWRLAQENQGPTNSDSEHPLRILQDIAAYDVAKPVAVTERVAEVALTWIDGSRASDSRWTPFDVLDAVHATSGLSHSSDGRVFRSTPFTVNPAATAAIRRRALGATWKAALDTEVRLAIRAVQSLQSAARDIFRWFSHQPKRADVSRWRPAQVEAIRLLGEVSRDAPTTVTRLYAEAVLREMATFQKRGLIAQAVRGELVDHDLTTKEQLLVEFAPPELRSLRPRWNDIKQSAERDEAARIKLVAAIAGDGADVDHTAAVIIDAMATVAGAGWEPHPGELLGRLGRDAPLVALALADRVLDGDGPMLEGWLAALLVDTRRTHADALDRAERAVTTGRPALAAAVAHLCWMQWWGDSGPSERDLALVQQLVASETPQVRALAVRSIAPIYRWKQDVGHELLNAVDIAGDMNVAQAWCDLFTGPGAIDALSLTCVEVEKALSQLEPLRRLDDYPIEEFLRAVLPRHPRAVIAMLLRRTSNGAAAAGTHDPLPHQWTDSGFLSGVLNGDDLISALRAVRDHAGTSGRAALYCPSLFWALSSGLDTAARTVIDESLNSGEPAKIHALAPVMTAMPPQLVMGEFDYVVDVLERAQAVDAGEARRLANSIAAAASAGAKYGVPGQPSREDLDRRDRAAALAKTLPPGSAARELFEMIASDAQQMLDFEEKLDEELVTP